MADLLGRLQEALASRYRVDRELGAGGMAVVFLAEDLRHRRPVALKVLRPELAAEIGPERFVREIETAARLTHPHILPLLDSGAAGELLYYVMPYVEGESLRGRLAREKQLPLDDALRIAREVADALSYAHSHDVVHRDIKPENILLQSGHAVVADFGIARAITMAGGGTLTGTGMALGTPAYMSPEQAAGSRDLDGRSDLYSLGCVLYEMLAGQPPFTGPTVESLVHQHLSVEAPSITNLRPAVPGWVATAVQRSLAKTPADRFSPVALFAEALAHRETEAMAAASPIASAPPARRRWRPALLIGAAVFVVGGALWIWIRPRPLPAPASATVIAVFPFSVRGSEQHAYLAEGIVTLLSTSLDGAGALRTVDPRAVLSVVGAQGGGTPDPEKARAAAERLSAGLFVLGDVLQVGERLRLDATLYDGSRGPEPLARGTVEGHVNDISETVDELTTQILAGYAGQKVGLSRRISSLAAVTTTSLPALKAYLEGETEFRRGRNEAAMETFQRAVEADTSFALALYRLSLAAAWAQHFQLATDAAVRALRHAGRLPEREHRLLDAEWAFLRGAADDAERLYRDILSAYPSEVEAWYMLGETLFHYNRLRGRPLVEARAPMERVLALDPGHYDALFHLIQISIWERATAEVDSLVRRYIAVVHGDDRSRLSFLVARALLSGDRVEQERLMVELEHAPFQERMSAFGEAVVIRELPYALRIASLLTQPRQSPVERARGFVVLGRLRLAGGQVRAAREAWRIAGSLDPAAGLATYVYLSTLPLPMPEKELETAREHILGWDIGSLGRGHGSFISAEIGVLVKPYLLGLVCARLGRDAEALRYVTEVERLEGKQGLWRAPRHLGALVRALTLAAEGRQTAALALLEKAPTDMPFGIMSDRFPWEPFSHYQRAELLHGLGREEEALRWYDLIDEAGSRRIQYLAPSHLRRGEIQERLGHTEKAIHHYRKFIDLWKDCDPELRPMIEDAQRRMERLMAQRG